MLHPAKRLKTQLMQDADNSANRDVRREARKLMGLKQNQEVLKEAVARGQEIDSVLGVPSWVKIEAILFKAMGLDRFTQAVRSGNREAKETSADHYAVVQGILDTIYNLSARGKVAQKMLDEIRAKEGGNKNE